MFKASLVAGVLMSAAAIAGETSGTRRPVVLTLGRVRALVVSPHPDDATLGAGGLIQRVLHEGGALRIVQMTGGEAWDSSHGGLVPLVWRAARA
jgi:hypothetical protein